MFLFSSDWHLTSRPKDEYRWEIFSWLARQASLRKVQAIFILGDIADCKNNHPNEFINRLVDSLRELSNVAPIYMLTGNHDYTNPDAPLLRFLNSFPIIQYNNPTSIRLFGYDFLFVPNQKTQVSFTKTLNELKAKDHDFVLMHQTFNGSVTSNGTSIKGFDLIKSSKKTIYISGDVHVPQTIGDVLYCGSPHPVHFGDSFKPRVLLWDGKTIKSIPRTTLKKKVIKLSSVDDLSKVDDLTEGDHVKIIMEIPRSRFGEWEDSRNQLEKIGLEKGWIVSGIELQQLEKEGKILGSAPSKTSKPSEQLRAFCESNKIDDDLLNFGLGILSGDTSK